MRHRFLVVTAIALCSLPSPRLSAHDDKKATAVFNKVSLGVSGGHLEALDLLKTLDYDDGVPALLIFFRQNHNVMRETTQTRAFSARTAQLAGEFPNAEIYFKGLFKKGPEGKVPNWVANQREDAIDCLIYMKMKMAVRVCAESLSEPELDIDRGLLGKALADMNIKGAPYTNKTRREATTPDAVAKWKEWYEANKATYAAPAPTAQPAP